MSAPYDPRYEAARATDQSGGRGWCFAPETSPKTGEGRFIIATLAQLAACIVPVCILWAWVG